MMVMCVLRREGGVNLKILNYKAIAVVATKFQRHCAPNLKLFFFIVKLSVKDTDNLKYSADMWL